MRIGLEISDARLTAVLVDDEGKVLARAGRQAAADVADAVRELVAEIRAAARASIVAGVAASVPDAPPVVQAISALRAGGLALADVVLPSGAAAAVAESWIGAAAGSRDVVFLAVDEHATGGIVRDGAPMPGVRGRAASLAWLSLNPVEREDYRKIGCLEAEVAASGIVRRFIWRIKSGDRSKVQDIVGGDLMAITIDHVLRAARDGDGVAISVVRDTARYIGMAAANLVAIADPQALVLGGIIASSADLLLEPVRAEVTRRLPPPMTDGLAIAAARLGADAAAIGAARFAAPALQ